MNSSVTRPNGKPKTVKNLGWLLSHWKQVEQIGFNFNPDPKRMVDGVLWARLRDGTLYETEYSDLSVCWTFLDRPIFQGLPFTLDNVKRGSKTQWFIGSSEWRTVKKLDYASFMKVFIG